LRQLRLAAGLTQDALAERAGLSRRGVQDAERGLIRPQRETVQRLAGALRLTDEQRRQLLEIAQPKPRTRLERSLHLLPRAEADQGDAATLRHNLPVQLTSFVGRDQELAALTRLFDPRASSCRLVTLTGPGGCGKTRLGLEVAARFIAPAPGRPPKPGRARRGDLPLPPKGTDGRASPYPGGVWLVELGPLSNPATVSQAVAWVLGVREWGSRPLFDALLEALRASGMLLILDTCEHLLDACAGLVTSLLQGCPALRILATSREPLGVAGETRWPVPSLPFPAANQVISPTDLGSAPAAPHFRLTERNVPAVA